MSSVPGVPNPPEVWKPARRLAKTVMKPIENFLQVEASSGIALLVTAVIALAWANSPWSESYESLWHLPVSIGIGQWVMTEDLHFWINDLFMSIFFLVVGLEVKREIYDGALSNLKFAMLPIAAALGGMIVPAIFFLAISGGGPAADAWGVPMATDIAFAVGMLMLLGKRVPVALRVLLLAIAIIDDIGAILVIAIFYSSSLDYSGFILVGGGVAAIVALFKVGVRPGFLFLFPALVVWFGMHKVGIHPTIAGVLVGLLIPVRSWFSRQDFIRTAKGAIDEFEKVSDAGKLGHDLIVPLDKLARARREAVSPALRLQTALHPWVAFGIMPVFALANAGINLGGMEFSNEAMNVFAGVLAGLSLGKPIGIILFSWLAIKLGLCVLPVGIGWTDVLIVGLVAGIGFTMAIFIAELAFVDEALLGIGKLAVLAATAVSAIGGLTVGRLLLAPDEVDDLDAGDLEANTAFWTTVTKD